MKRIVLLLALIAVFGLSAQAQTYYTSPDVPTDLVGNSYTPWEIVRKDPPNIYGVTLSLPTNTAADSVHHMCSGDWLVSLEAAANLGGTFYEAYDVVRHDPTTTTYSIFFCGGPMGIPAGSNVDAAFLRTGDASPLVLSFDVPTDLTGLGGGIYDPADLVEFQKTGPGCAGWTLVGLFFDGSTATPPVPDYYDVTGADRRSGRTYMSFDIPSTLGPTYLPGDMVWWDPGLPGFGLYEMLPGWPGNRSSRVDAFTFPPDPGVVTTMYVDKSSLTAGDLTITWTASTSAGGEDYGIYEGTIASPWSYNHAAVDCNDAGGDLTEDITPGSGDRYYLVVPHHPDMEGGYGTDSGGTQRPQGSSPCRAVQGFDCP
jgi:hypothetical protein